MAVATHQHGDGFNWVRGHCGWLPPSAAIPVVVAQGLVRESVFWWAHPSGHVVSVPRFADRVEVHGRRVILLRFGVNTMHLGAAIHEARLILLSSYKRVWRGARDSVGYASRLIQLAVIESFETTTGGDSSRAFRVAGTRVVLGAHWVDSELAARFLVRASGLERFEQSVAAHGLPERDSLVEAFLGTPLYEPKLPKRKGSRRKKRLIGPRAVPGRVVWVAEMVTEFQRLYPTIGKRHRVWTQVERLLDSLYWSWREGQKHPDCGALFDALKARVWTLLNEAEGSSLR